MSCDRITRGNSAEPFRKEIGAFLGGEGPWRFMCENHLYIKTQPKKKGVETMVRDIGIGGAHV